MGLFDGVPRAAAQDRGVGRPRRAARPAGAAGHRRRRAIAIGGGRGARLRLPPTRRADRRGGAEPRRQRAACAARGRGDRRPRHSRARRHPARCFAGAARAPSRPGAGRASTRTSPRGSNISPTWPSIISISMRSSSSPCRRTARPRGSMRRCRRLAGASRWRKTTPSASSIRMCSTAGGSAGAEIVPFSPLADAAPPEDCDSCWLPGGYPELHAGALAAADRFRAGVTQFAATRPVHGECGGYMVLGESLEDADGVSHRMLGLLGHATSFAHRKLHLGYRQARLLCRQSAWDKPGDAPARPRIPLCRLDLARPGRAAGRACRRPGRRRSARQADGAGNVTGTFFHAIAKSLSVLLRDLRLRRRSPCRCGRRARRAGSARRARRRSLRQAACRDRASGCRPSSSSSSRCPASAETWPASAWSSASARSLANGATAAVQTKPSSSTGMRRCRAASVAPRMAASSRPPKRRGDAQRIAEDARRAARAPASIAVALAREAGVVDAGAAAGPARAAAAEQRRRDRRGRGGVADAHLAEAHEIGLGRQRVVARRHGGEELRLVHGGLLAVKSAVGRSSVERR